MNVNSLTSNSMDMSGMGSRFLRSNVRNVGKLLSVAPAPRGLGT